MRFIDPYVVAAKIPPDWLNDAVQRTRELLAATTRVERQRLVSNGDNVWSKLKDVLSRITDGKCWYCESRNLRSDNAVDHYRPKGRVEGDRDHEGYWWLAFDYKNYRFSCTLCNSRRKDLEGGTAGGKQDRFPIADTSTRARRPTDRIDQEKPLLIDPCRRSDVALLWFEETGQIRVNPETAKLDGLADQKVATSVRDYHLDHVKLVGDRRRVYLRIQDLCEKGDFAYADLDHSQNIFNAVIDDIARAIEPTTEYSATARCALRGLRTSSPTAELFISELY